MDLGAGRRGVDMGPSAVRLAGPEREAGGSGIAGRGSGQRAWWISPNRCPSVPPTRAICRRSRTPARVWRIWWKRPPTQRGSLWFWAAIIRSPSVPWPACRGIFTRRQEKLGLIWIDAHADMNTPESSPSGNVHGMPLACCIGLGPARADATRRVLARGRARFRGHRRVCAASTKWSG